ncbi:hypothetical protein COA01_23090 [Bacillus cereus]|uniref:hypothetical protein n=1 Tax=Bacillus cereus TaxID=1396 RepID=UPI000BFC1C47|nr:hypothetical protein [Bacillus cereus]PGP18631.1 hypothetical protein COA01_23090 [Bacillus cereus]
MPSIYLAGKIDVNDWRHGIFRHLRVYGSEGEDVFGYKDDNYKKVMTVDSFLYKGPFFIGDDHRMMHGPNTHGRGTTKLGVWSSPACPDLHSSTEQEVVDMCTRGISESSFVFCWLDDETAYGTISELGYAAVKEKHIAIAVDNKMKTNKRFMEQIQFILKKAQRVIFADTAKEAWDMFTNKQKRREFFYLPSVVDYDSLMEIHDKIQQFCWDFLQPILKKEKAEKIVNVLYRYELAKKFIEDNRNFLKQKVPYIMNHENEYFYKKDIYNGFIDELMVIIDLELVNQSMSTLHFKAISVSDTELRYFYKRNCKEEKQYMFFDGEQCTEKQWDNIETWLRFSNLQIAPYCSELNLNVKQYQELKESLCDADGDSQAFSYMLEPRPSHL